MSRFGVPVSNRPTQLTAATAPPAVHVIPSHRVVPQAGVEAVHEACLGLIPAERDIKSARSLAGVAEESVAQRATTKKRLFFMAVAFFLFFGIKMVEIVDHTRKSSCLLPKKHAATPLCAPLTSRDVEAPRVEHRQEGVEEQPEGHRGAAGKAKDSFICGVRLWGKYK